MHGLENTTGWFCIYFASGFLLFKMNMGLALWFMFEFVLFLVFCMFETFGSYFVVCLRLHSYLFCIFCQITKNTLCIFVLLLYFPLLPKMHFVFLYFFCIFPFLHRLHFVLLYFSFFRHAVKEQNRESTNVCCTSLLLMILPLSVLFFCCNLGLYVFGIFNDYRCYRL